ncbi:hypothetical protein [Nonomuraea sp. NPDC003201]
MTRNLQPHDLASPRCGAGLVVRTALEVAAGGLADLASGVWRVSLTSPAAYMRASSALCTASTSLWSCA